MPQATPDWFMHFSLGSWDPEDCLASVIDDRDEAVRAVDALRAGGFGEGDIRLFLGREVVDLDGDITGHRGFLKNIVCAVANISDDAAMAQDYLDEARRGHQILVVHAPAVERATVAHTIVEEHHAHLVRYYGRWAVRDLV